MKKIAVIVVLALVGLIVLAAPAGVEAQNAATKKKSLATFRLKDVDGTEVELDSEALKGQNLAICFLTTWSELSQRQAKAVAAASKDFKGKLVFVAGGGVRQVRELRSALNIEGSLWLKAATSVGSDFRDCFDPAMVSLDRVPALVVVDVVRKVHHASTGELTADEIAAALKIE